MQPRRHEDTKHARRRELRLHDCTCHTDCAGSTTALVLNATTKTRSTHEDESEETDDIMLRIPSKLSNELEELIHRTIGCCITVHRTLGPGLLEGIYCRAICLELGVANI